MKLLAVLTTIALTTILATLVLNTRNMPDGLLSHLLPEPDQAVAAGDDPNRASVAAAHLQPELTRDLETMGLAFGNPVFIRIFKEERVLELWVRQVDQSTYQLFRTYPVAAMSGELGPKLAEGDRQAPEGFYFVRPGQMHPTSKYHLAFNLGFPNRYDKEHQRHGSALMVHGNRVSIGCFAMTDAKIEEIYTLCDAALGNGQAFFRVHCFPFRMNAERMQEASGHPWFPFWQNLMEGYALFEQTRIPPNTTVRDKRYRFD